MTKYLLIAAAVIPQLSFAKGDWDKKYIEYKKACTEALSPEHMVKSDLTVPNLQKKARSIANEFAGKEGQEYLKKKLASATDETEKSCLTEAIAE